MRDIYFSTYKLGAKNQPSPKIEEVIPLLEDWLFDPRREVERTREYEALAPEQQFSFGEGRGFATRFYHGSDHQAYALKFKHPDSQIENKRWVTEVVLSEGSNGERSTRASISLFTGYEGAKLTPDVDSVSRPRLVKSLIEGFGAYESLPLSLEPRKLETSQVETFVELLKHDQRVFPVVWISAHNSDGHPLVNPIPAADWLAGVAHVIVSEGVGPSRAVGNLLDEKFNCFNGAVRIYWPGFSEEDSRFDHKLWLPHEVESLEDGKRHGFRSHLLSYVSEVSTNRLIDDVVEWSDVRRLQSRNELQRLREEGQDQEALKVAEEIINDLEGEKQQLKEQVGQLQDEKERARNEAEQWRKAYQEEQKTEDEAPIGPVSEDLPPATLTDAVERILSEYGPDAEETRVRIPKNVRGGITDEFEDAESAYDALKWLATTFVDAKRGEERCPNLDLSCRRNSGFGYNAHQSDRTMGEYPDDYHLRWNGEGRALKRHLGKGSSKDPRETLRIAFFYDEEQQEAIVGYVGQHQRTRAT